ncbi:hypothetical protein BGZ76_003938 [Entomortierella beljakovae]|nr:hypothetical protein BGZ76_003938 [Entomortierella beljakovae]
MTFRRILSQKLPLLSQFQGSLARSSHGLAVVENKAYIFGGELQPRIPVDANLYVYDLQDNSINVISPSESTPSPRVGATLSAIGNKIYLYGGRGGKDMNPLESTLYAFDTISQKWEVIEVKNGDVPEPRSYHAMTASNSEIFVFGGCPSKGRLNDLHQFTISTGAWTTLPTPPITPRGGAAMTYHDNKVYVHGGFNGQEQSDLVIYNIPSGEWTQTIPSPNTPVPGARSVHAIVPITAKDSESDRLLILFGEGDPSALGHAGAGNFWGDIWTVTLPKALNHAPGSSLLVNYEKIALEGYQGNSESIPCPRGWFPAHSWNDKVIVSGGLSSTNERLSDLYLLTLD